MTITLKRLLCHFLAILMVMAPFQTGQASMIGTDQMLSATTAQAERATVLNFLSRSETVSQLQSLGLDPQSAKSRVEAMTDAEVATLAGKIQALPAGAEGLVLLVLVVFIIWYFAFRR